MYFLEYAPKKNIETKIYKDFFTQEELQRILGSIDNAKTMAPGTFHAPIVQEQSSRVHIEVIYPADILRKLEAFASDLCGEDVVLTHNSYYHYSKNYNQDIETPILRPHRDLDNYYSKLTLDYQLYKNVDWNIVIEGTPYNLEVGDMLAFWGAGLVHWRENIVLDKNEETAVLTLHFSNREDHQRLNNFARLPHEREKRKNANREDPSFQKYNQEWEQERVNFNKKKEEV